MADCAGSRRVVSISERRGIGAGFDSCVVGIFVDFEVEARLSQAAFSSSSLLQKLVTRALRDVHMILDIPLDLFF